MKKVLTCRTNFRSVFFTAVFSGMILMMSGCGKPVDVHAKGPGGKTALHKAVLIGKLGAVKSLIEKGSDVNVKDDTGWTALHYAAFDGNVDVIKYLVEKGADVNEKDVIDMTAFHVAAQNGKLDAVKFFIEKGADVNARYGVGGTVVLHLAAKEGKTDVVRYLVEKGADVNAITYDDKTPFDVADNDEIRKILRDAGGKSGKDIE